jgi:hypothetical protein
MSRILPVKLTVKLPITVTVTLASPQNLTIQSDDDSIIFSWDTALGATTYAVFSTINPGNGFPKTWPDHIWEQAGLSNEHQKWNSILLD